MIDIAFTGSVAWDSVLLLQSELNQIKTWLNQPDQDAVYEGINKVIELEAKLGFQDNAILRFSEPSLYISKEEAVLKHICKNPGRTFPRSRDDMAHLWQVLDTLRSTTLYDAEIHALIAALKCTQDKNTFQQELEHELNLMSKINATVLTRHRLDNLHEDQPYVYQQFRAKLFKDRDKNSRDYITLFCDMLDEHDGTSHIDIDALNILYDRYSPYLVQDHLKTAISLAIRSDGRDERTLRFRSAVNYLNNTHGELPFFRRIWERIKEWWSPSTDPFLQAAKTFVASNSHVVSHNFLGPNPAEASQLMHALLESKRMGNHSAYMQQKINGITLGLFGETTSTYINSNIDKNLAMPADELVFLRKYRFSDDAHSWLSFLKAQNLNTAENRNQFICFSLFEAKTDTTSHLHFMSAIIAGYHDFIGSEPSTQATFDTFMRHIPLLMGRRVLPDNNGMNQRAASDNNQEQVASLISLLMGRRVLPDNNGMNQRAASDNNQEQVASLFKGLRYYIPSSAIHDPNFQKNRFSIYAKIAQDRDPQPL